MPGLPSLISWLPPAALWLWLFFHLHYEWSLNPQYSYGWAVPFLAAFMFYLRWSDRPAPAATGNRTAASIALGALLILLLPLRVIEEANPDWRLISWSLGLIAVSFSLLRIFQAGGSTWLRHFAFPICFVLVAVPWPVRLENLIVQNLTRAVAFVAVEIAGWLGIGALQIGNVIELHNGFVGVNEACSGVKTLQAAIMVALVLGELFSLGASRRIILLCLGCGWVFVCNILRATVLVVIAAGRGTEALEHWHDLIGAIVIVLGMAGLFVMGWLLRNRNFARPDRVGASSVPIPGATNGLITLSWLLVIFAAAEFWYRSHEKQLATLPAWEVRWPNESKLQPIPDETRAILRYNRAQSATWDEPRAVHWWSFFARWEPGRTASQLVRSHSPEICLPAVGRTFRRELPPISVATSATPLRFRAYEFVQNDRPLFVFVSIEEDKAVAVDKATLPSEWNAAGRLRAAWNGQRNLGQRLLEIAVLGYDDFSSAREAMTETVRGLVQRSAVTD